MSTQVPPRPPLERLITADAHTAPEDIILVRSSATNPIGSCFRGIAIAPGGLGYQTRAMLEHEPWSRLLVPYTAPVEVPAPVQPDPAPPLADGSWAAPKPETPPPPPDRARVLSAREAVAFIEAAGPGEYEHLRSDPRRSVKDAIADRDMDLRAAGRGA